MRAPAQRFCLVIPPTVVSKVSCNVDPQPLLLILIVSNQTMLLYTVCIVYRTTVCLYKTTAEVQHCHQALLGISRSPPDAHAMRLQRSSCDTVRCFLVRNLLGTFRRFACVSSFDRLAHASTVSNFKHPNTEFVRDRGQK